MPSRRLPDSVPTTLHGLKTPRDFYLLTPLPADRAIDAATFAKLDPSVPTSFLNRWLKELGDIATAQAAGTPITERLQPKKDRAALLVSHFHQVLDLGITRGTFAAGARSYYGRDAHDTRIPDLSTYEDIATAADDIKKGEADRQTAEGANFIPMALPSAAEVETARVQFKTDLDLSQQAAVTLDREEEEAGALYPEAQALAVDIAKQVEHHHRQDPRRRQSPPEMHPLGRGLCLRAGRAARSRSGHPACSSQPARAESMSKHIQQMRHPLPQDADAQWPARLDSDTGIRSGFLWVGFIKAASKE